MPNCLSASFTVRCCTACAGCCLTPSVCPSRPSPRGVSPTTGWRVYPSMRPCRCCFAWVQTGSTCCCTSRLAGTCVARLSNTALVWQPMSLCRRCGQEDAYTFLEAIRKLFCTAATRSSSILAVMKLGATAGGESGEHKMYMTDLDHSSTGCYTALIVLAVPTVPAMPGVRPLNHPAFFQRREAFRARRTHRHFDVPAGPMLGHPGVKGVIVILLIRKDRDETRKVVRRDVAEQERGRHPIIETGTGNEDGQEQAQRIDQQRPLTSFDFLAAIIAALGAPHFGGLDRLAIDACGTGGRLVSRFHAGSFAQGLDHLGPCPVVAPLGKGVIDGTFGQQIVRQHIPLAATSVQVEQCIQDFPQVYLPRAPSLCVLLGGWDHRFHNRPLLVRQI